MYTCTYIAPQYNINLWMCFYSACFLPWKLLVGRCRIAQGNLFLLLKCCHKGVKKTLV